MKNKLRYYGKISIILAVAIGILGSAVFGIYSLVDKLIGKQGTDPFESNPPTSSEKEDENEASRTDAPVEDKNSKVVLDGEFIKIENPGENHSYAVLTGDNILSIQIKGRVPDKYGPLPGQGHNLIESASINEEQNGYSVQIYVSEPFTMEINESANEISYKIVRQKNSDVLRYKNHMDRIHMHIDNAIICSEIDSEIKLYTETYDKGNKTSTLEISNGYVPVLENETLFLNDGYFEYIEIERTAGKTRFIFKHMDDVKIYPNTRTFDAAFTFIKPHTEGMLIVIDPGHGGIDGGAVSIDESIIEKHLVLDMSRMLEKNLEEMGYNVYNLRQEDEYLGLMERTDIANLLEADIFISVHINSYSDDTSVSGTVTLYKESYELASNIQSEIISRTRSVNMGTVKKEDLSILNRAQMEAVIVETGFVTNEAEAMKLTDPDYQKQITDGIAAGIDAYVKGASGR